MKLMYTLSGGQTLLKYYPIYNAGTATVADALFMIGATQGTNSGFAILATGACAGVIGTCLTADSAATGKDSKQDGTAYTKVQFIINPDAVYLADIVAPSTSTIAVASSSTTTLTITSLENGISGGWIWGNDQQLQYITATAAGSCTTKTATGYTSANYVSRVNPVFHLTNTIDSTGVKINLAAAAGSWTCLTVENYISGLGVPFQPLDPTKHSGVTYQLTDTTFKLQSAIFNISHMFSQSTAA